MDAAIEALERMYPDMEIEEDGYDPRPVCWIEHPNGTVWLELTWTVYYLVLATSRHTFADYVGSPCSLDVALATVDYLLRSLDTCARR